MELQTVNQVSKAIGISAQMLRYYERSGLVKSLRKEGYAYRVYDNENIMRLQQIVILRKLQIPVKQISVILNSPDAATAIMIFNENIIALQKEIIALESIKSALELYVAKIEELSAVRMDLNLLTDKSVMDLAQSLSLIQKNIKEYQTMENVKQASEYLAENEKKNVMVINLPKCKAISSGWQWWDDLFIQGGFSQWMWANRQLHKEAFFNTAVYCVDKKADFHDDKACMNFIVHDHVTQAEADPYKLIDFEGGWYAYMSGSVSDAEYCDAMYHNILKWLEGTGYEYDDTRYFMAQSPGEGHPEIEKSLGYVQFQRYVPIKLRDKNASTVI